jgi:hypothetical protein
MSLTSPRQNSAVTPVPLSQNLSSVSTTPESADLESP